MEELIFQSSETESSTNYSRMVSAFPSPDGGKLVRLLWCMVKVGWVGKGKIVVKGCEWLGFLGGAP